MENTSLKILVADDDADDRAILEDAMMELNASQVLCFAQNGEEVLRLLGTDFNADQKPALIILDLNMPKLNGTETLRRIKEDERFNTVPVIIYSTSLNPLEKDKCMLLGAHSYITKPVTLQESMDTAKAFLSFCEETSLPVNYRQ
ncbi:MULTISPECIES: response regulator [Niastella]|uniref:Response regulator n=1 Tax=Niastella soli TaxID=2821487 RepID=A0ABS3Z3F4_9BACT|nr:response regulator [Niastella soli]MBO9204568.1 response regulator [Niastella soli]